MNNAINVAHISYSESQGGASRASTRIHKALQASEKELGIYSKLYVIEKTSEDPQTIELVPKNVSNKLWQKVHPRLSKIALSLTTENHNKLLSIAWPNTGVGARINKLIDQGLIDIVHLHWIGNSTLSIEEIGRIKCPAVWTLHDQWAFSGAEHYQDFRIDTSGARDDRIKGFRKGALPIDLDNATLNRKLRNWQSSVHVACPSQWIANCVNQSAFNKKWITRTISYPIDTSKWEPINQSEARKILALPEDEKIILFGAIGGSSDPRKGADLIKSAIRLIKENSEFTNIKDHRFCIFGESHNETTHKDDTIYLGKLTDDVALRLAYSASDVMVIPSRQEAFGQTASEAQTCGTPAVAFRIGGLQDAIEHLKTGSLAEPYDPLSLARSIQWTIESKERNTRLGQQARQRAVRLWNQRTIAEQYAKMYKDALASS